MTARRTPTLDVERDLTGPTGRVVAGMDEVGRGALAGPVTVGVVVALPDDPVPPGLRDSKLLSAAARERLRPELLDWGAARAVGSATPGEIDRWGIVPALRLAGLRALAALPCPVDVVLLDGVHDWLTVPPRSLWDDADEPDDAPAPFGGRVVVRAKADRDCASVAAASVLAKTDRDAVMVSLAAEHPAYGWEGNKGYGAANHLAALREHGPCGHHRTSWRLPPQDSHDRATGIALPGGR